MRLAGLVAAGAVAAGALVLSGCTDEPAPEEPVEAETAEAPADPPPDAVVVVKEVQGKLETRRGNAWVPTKVGDRLGRDEAVRSGPEGEAVLAVGQDATMVYLKSRSEVAVKEVTKEVARLRLERGRLGADLKGKLALAVESTGSEVVAEAKQGRFTVFNNGAGMVAVAAETAEVDLKTTRGVEKLKAGSQVTVEEDAVREPTAIPESVYLSVVWPTKMVTKARTTRIRGKVDPSSEVVVNGRSAAVGEDGAFELEVDLRNGANPIDIQATDPLGRAKKLKRVVEARRTGPHVEADAKGLWK